MQRLRQQASDSSSPTEPFSFSVAISEPSAIDPAMTVDVEGAHVTRLLFDPLVKLTPDLELSPGTADTWSLGDDGVTWTFKLNPDATYSDGPPSRC